MNANEQELERLRTRNADLVELLEAVERESGWVAKDTPLPVYIGELRKALQRIAELKCMHAFSRCCLDGAIAIAKEVLRKEKE